MLQLISGDNATGKTRYLDSIYYSKKPGTCVYNNMDTTLLYTIPVNQEALQKVFPPASGHEGLLHFQDMDVYDVSYMTWLYNLLCRNVELILLDEPDLPAREIDVRRIYQVLYQLKAYTDIIVVTHDEELVPYADAFYTVRSNGDTVSKYEITQEEFIKEIYCDEEMASI